MSENRIRIGIISPPDREMLCAEIMVGTEQWAEVNQEDGRWRVEFYPRQDGKPWVISFDEATQSLFDAKEELRAR